MRLLSALSLYAATMPVIIIDAITPLLFTDRLPLRF